MYLQETSSPLVYKFKYYNNNTEHVITGGDCTDSRDKRQADAPEVKEDQKQQVKSFLEPDETTFSQIRRKLSTLSLSTEYNKEPFVLPPMSTERKRVPRRISSITAHDTDKRNPKHQRRKGLASRGSFRSDEHEYRIFQSSANDPFRKPLLSDADATNKQEGTIITPRQHPELFSQQIRALEKTHTPRVASPKSSRSVDSSGKVHLGLIETLDLTEQLDDVEKIKQRYSSDYFTKSLSLYKLRGHDRCFNRSGMTEHIPRGLRLHSPDSMRSGSKVSFESAQTINSITSPYSSRSPHVRLTPMVLPHHYLQDPSPPLHVHEFKQAPSRQEERRNQPTSDEKVAGKRERRKSVGFNMVPTEVYDDGVSSNASSPRDSPGRELKSILKKKPGALKPKRVELQVNEKEGDEFHANANYYWKFQMPRLQSPAPSAKVRKATQFRKNMYHYGQGISDEFEQVINNYGNCRQSSMVRDPSMIRDSSSHVT